MLILIIQYLIAFITLFVIFAFSMDRLLRSKGYVGQVSDHFDGKTFKNIGDVPKLGGDRGRWGVFKWMISRDKNVWVKTEAKKSIPADRVDGSRIVATFINHATVLLQTEGLNIITDPVYAEYAGPFPYTGPRRHSEPGIDFDNLPPIDVVLLSHNHYDHLDIVTLRKIQEKFHPTIIVPLGNAAFLASKGVEVTHELDWWDTTVLGVERVSGLSVQSVPAQHFSARALSDRNKTLWCGYVISTPHGDIYFAGDTGYGPFVKEIKARFPKGFRFGMLPVGAYEPKWFMSPVHASPDEAFAMKKELAIHDAMAIHFGTFKLADDAQNAPPTRLKELAQENSTMQGTFVALQNGESVELFSPVV